MTYEVLTEAFIEALYFTDTGEDDQPSVDAELAPETRDRLEADCKSFWYRVEPFLEPGQETAAGHDFWLTRNGHGSGFWDGDWPKYGDMFTKIAECYGGIDTYAGDDGYIYAS